MSFLISFLKVVLVVDAVLLTIVVILQSGRGGGLAGAFGAASPTEAAFGAKTGLTKITWWMAGIFFAVCLALALLPHIERGHISEEGKPPVTAPSEEKVPGRDKTEEDTQPPPPGEEAPQPLPPAEK